jgi:mono/diheme cytochrome c family protein
VALSRLATLAAGFLLFVSQVSAQHQNPQTTPGAAAIPIRLGGEAGTVRSGGEAATGDVARGQYIVEHVVMCAECHSSRDGHGNIIETTRFKGGPIPVNPPWQNNWANRAPRIAGLPGYTDELIVRLLTQGAIGRDGNQLRLPMPRFTMTPQDALAVAAYLRTRH